MANSLSGSGSLVSVFRTEDPGVLPLAELALRDEAIEYLVRHADRSDSMEWTISQPPTNRAVVMEVLVAPDAADRARDLLAGLRDPAAAALPAGGASVGTSPDTSTGLAIRVEDADTGVEIASLTEADLQAVISHLDEQDPQTYLVDEHALRRLEHAPISPDMLDALRSALGDRETMNMRWSVR